MRPFCGRHESTFSDEVLIHQGRRG